MKKIVLIYILSIFLCIISLTPSFSFAMKSDVNVEGTIVSVDNINNKFVVSLSCDKTGKDLSICREKMSLNSKMVDVINVFLQKKEYSDNKIVKQLLKFFEKPIYINTVISVKESTKLGGLISLFSMIRANDVIANVKGNYDSDLKEVVADDINFIYKQEWVGKLVSKTGTNVLSLENSGYVIKATLSENTAILDKDGNKLFFSNLKLNDIFSVWGRDYESNIKLENPGLVKINAEDIVLIGSAVGENKEVDITWYCKSGLGMILGSNGNFYCAQRGNNICSGLKTKTNCPEDCLKKGDKFDSGVFVDEDFSGLEKGTFYGKVFGGARMKFATDKNTKTFSHEAGNEESTREDTESFILEDFVKGMTGRGAVGIIGYVLSVESGLMTVHVDRITVSVQ